MLYYFGAVKIDTDTGIMNVAGTDFALASLIVDIDSLGYHILWDDKEGTPEPS